MWWLLFLLDDIVPKPRGRIYRPEEIQVPEDTGKMAMLGCLIVTVAVVLATLGAILLVMS